MLRRNWTDGEIKDLMGQNLLHVMDEVDAVSDRLRGELPSAAMLSTRKDYPAKWGGPKDAYYPHEVQAEQKKVFRHDEL
jgi:hypothetical protein